MPRPLRPLRMHHGRINPRSLLSPSTTQNTHPLEIPPSLFKRLGRIGKRISRECRPGQIVRYAGDAHRAAEDDEVLVVVSADVQACGGAPGHGCVGFGDAGVGEGSRGLRAGDGGEVGGVGGGAVIGVGLG